MAKNITHAAICQMREELDKLEAQAKLELKDTRTHAVGLLRMDLVAECRRRLFFIMATLLEGPRDP